MSRIAKTFKEELAKHKQISFEDKVKSMSASEIIMAMVNGLKKPSTRIDMNTFGEYKEKKVFGVVVNKVCYGCAATNTICRIGNIKFSPDTIEHSSLRAEALRSDVWFLKEFERAIDWLRKGDVGIYNMIAKQKGFAEIINDSSLNLPILTTEHYREKLSFYEELANFQDKDEKA